MPELLALLHKFALEQHQAAPPVTLGLVGGQQLRGQVLSCQDGQVLLRLQGLELAYLAQSSIQAVTVHHRPDTLHLFSRGALVPAVGEPPSRLELRRRLQADLEELGQGLGHSLLGLVEWEAFPSDAGHELSRGLADLVQALREVGADEMGLEALRSLEELLVEPWLEGPSVQRRGKVLVIRFGLQGGVVRLLTPDQLKAQIEKGL